MTETEMILQAMKKDVPKPNKKRKMREIEPDPLVDGSDAILEMAQKQRKRTRQRKTKPLANWSGNDFVRYMSKNLDQFGLSLDAGMSMRDSTWILKVHDILVDVFPDIESNKIVKDYIDWWIGSYARIHRGPIYVGLLVHERYIDRFIQSRQNRSSLSYSGQISKSENLAVDPETESPPIDDETIYKMGGLSMLVMSRGVVNAFKVLKDSGDANAIMRLSTVLRSFSKDVLMSVMEITLNEGPYSSEYKIDFMSVSRPALAYHSISDFGNVDYREHFLET